MSQIFPIGVNDINLSGMAYNEPNDIRFVILGD